MPGDLRGRFFGGLRPAMALDRAVMRTPGQSPHRCSRVCGTGGRLSTVSFLRRAQPETTGGNGACLPTE